MSRNHKPAKNRARSSSRRRDAAPEPIDDGLQPQQRAFCLIYLSNGFNATAAYKKSHAGVSDDAARANGSRSLRIANIRAFLNDKLEDAWKPYQMGGEQALGRVGMLASEAEDDRVKLAALKVILEQTGKLKSIPDSIDALAAALKADILKNQHLENP